MLEKIESKIFAKINLSLNVVGNHGSMHLLDSVVASINVFDAITIYPIKGDDFVVEFIDNKIDALDNTVLRALGSLKKQLKNCKNVLDIRDTYARIVIKKGIPIGGGLGGSSADAAGVLQALDILLNLTDRGIDIKRAAMESGSDTLYMLKGGYARMRGVGERLEAIQSSLVLDVLLVSPNIPLLTKDVFKEFDMLYPNGVYTPSNNDELIYALLNNDISKAKNHVGNALFGAAKSICKGMEELYQITLKIFKSGVFMTGSGSMLAVIGNTKADLEKGAREFKGLGYQAIITTTRLNGFEYD